MHAICSVKSLELTLKMIAIIGIDEFVISFNHSLIRTIYHIAAAAIEVVLLMRGIRHVIAHAPNAFFHLALEFFQLRNKTREATMFIYINVDLLV